MLVRLCTKVDLMYDSHPTATGKCTYGAPSVAAWAAVAVVRLNFFNTSVLSLNFFILGCHSSATPYVTF